MSTIENLVNYEFLDLLEKSDIDFFQVQRDHEFPESELSLRKNYGGKTDKGRERKVMILEISKSLIQIINEFVNEHGAITRKEVSYTVTEYFNGQIPDNINDRFEGDSLAKILFPNSSASYIQTVRNYLEDSNIKLGKITNFYNPRERKLKPSIGPGANVFYKSETRAKEYITKKFTISIDEKSQTRSSKRSIHIEFLSQWNAATLSLQQNRSHLSQINSINSDEIAIEYLINRGISEEVATGIFDHEELKSVIVSDDKYNIFALEGIASIYRNETIQKQIDFKLRENK